MLSDLLENCNSELGRRLERRAAALDSAWAFSRLGCGGEGAGVVADFEVIAGSGLAEGDWGVKGGR